MLQLINRNKDVNTCYTCIFINYNINNEVRLSSSIVLCLNHSTANLQYGHSVVQHAPSLMFMQFTGQNNNGHPVSVASLAFLLARKCN